MSGGKPFARAVVRASAWLTRRADRARWREEWLAEIDAAPASSATVRRALGAPRDAVSLRRLRPHEHSPAAGSTWRAALASDIKYAWRQLFTRPGHTVAVIACLGIGLAASVGTFSVLMSLMYGALPGMEDRQSLARVYLGYDSAVSIETVDGGRRVAAEPLSLSDFAVLRELPAGSVLERIAVEGLSRMTAIGAHGPVTLTGSFVSGEFFATLGTNAQRGRLLLPDDERSAAPPVVVVSDYFWRTHLDGRPDALGKPIVAAGQSYVVVGIAPEQFQGSQPREPGRDQSRGTQLWLPLQHASRQPTSPTDDEAWLQAIGRLRQGRTVAEAQTQLSVTASRLAATNPSRRANATAVVRSLGFGAGNAPLFLLFIVAMVLSLPLTVLAIGCANVANLQLARATERARELAVRLSLGATRGQLVRLLALETLVRTVAAVALSIAVVSGILSYVQPLIPLRLTVDWRASLFALALVLAVSFGTGLLPAWLVLRTAASGQLKQNAQGGGLGHQRLRSTLVVVQMALSLALLSVTGTFIRTIQHMELSAPPALRQQFVAEFDPAELGMTSLAARQFADAFSARVAADPRVIGVAVAQRGSVRVGVEGAPRSSDRFATLLEATPAYLPVMDVPVLTGRALAASDAGDVVLVSAALADLLAPGGSPVGQTLHIEDGQRERRAVIAGVAADFATRPTAARPGPVVYASLPPALTSRFSLRVRSNAPDAIAADLRTLLRDVDPRVAWTSLRRGDASYLEEAVEMRGGLPVIAGCAIVALLLAATGLFAVISYVVTLRRREIGVRLAIGARPQQIVGLVMHQAAWLVVFGTVAGLALALPAAFTMRATFVAPVHATDPLAFVPNVALLAVVAFLAAVLPARQAAAVDPAKTLRQD